MSAATTRPVATSARTPTMPAPTAMSFTAGSLELGAQA
eukprot:CAMPEP_0179147140 /NCGR_PEP_ID=MMETSP0796-20121207/71111_1 /TAXON_ID=73915 /ORGANISM="Pyrodinium bahamense, Strain pbaha01" /LENGTH=37 /DNA_ID= /DNA_START= /DNA_END= /DNA_ORIENTATION=